MAELVRLSITMEQDLHEQLEEILQLHGYENRSEFIRDMIRTRLVEREWERDEEVVGTITMIYDHCKRDLAQKLTSYQHEEHDLILATTHVHLDHDMCAEVIIARGRASTIQRMADRIRQVRGVLHTQLSMSTIGGSVPR